MSLSVVDAFANEIASSSGVCSVLAASQFLMDAESEGMWDSSVKHSKHDALTIFVPENYTSGDCAGYFDEFWRRHVVRGTVRLGSDSVQQLTTLSNLVIAVYPADGTALDGDATYAVAGMPMGSPGMEHGDHRQAYQVIAFGPEGRSVWANYPASHGSAS